MFALGCIQSLKCNTNKCPTGVTSLDPELMAGLVVGDKAERVLRYHQKTEHAALEIVGAIGLESASQVEAKHIFRRVSSTKVLSYEQQYPLIEVSAPAGFAAHPARGLDACSPCVHVARIPLDFPPCLALVVRALLLRRVACCPDGATRAQRCRGGMRRGVSTCRRTRITTSATPFSSRRIVRAGVAFRRRST